jgi:hypothetical protein
MFDKDMLYSSNTLSQISALSLGDRVASSALVVLDVSGLELMLGNGVIPSIFMLSTSSSGTCELSLVTFTMSPT